MNKPNDPRPLIETAIQPDQYVGELARIERIGPCARLIFAVDQGSLYHSEPRTERVVVAKIVIPLDRLHDMAVTALGFRVVPPEEVKAFLAFNEPRSDSIN